MDIHSIKRLYANDIKPNNSIQMKIKDKHYENMHGV